MKSSHSNVPGQRQLACLLGASLGTGNRGVSALGASLVNLVHATVPETDSVLLVGHRDNRPFDALVGPSRQPVRVLNYRLSPKAALREQLLWILLLALLYRCVPSQAFRRWIAGRNPWLHAVVTARFVGEICGGDSFSDIYGLRRFVSRTLPTIIAILVRGEVVLLPQTYGPFKLALARRIASWIVQRASVVLARDEAGTSVARDLGAPAARVQLCPDVAFALPLCLPADPAIAPPLPNRAGRCLIGLNVSGLLFHGGYSRSNMFALKLDYPAFVRQLILALLQHDNHDVLLVPHTFAPPGRVESDNEASTQVRNSLPPSLAARVHLVTHAYDQHELKGLIGTCDFFIGSRMHACIAALSQGIPTVGVAYSRKFTGVFQSVAVPDAVLDGRELEASQAVQQVLSLYARRQELRARLASSVPAARARLHAVFADLLAAPPSVRSEFDLRPTAARTGRADPSHLSP